LHSKQVLEIKNRRWHLKDEESKSRPRVWQAAINSCSASFFPSADIRLMREEQACVPSRDQYGFSEISVNTDTPKMHSCWLCAGLATVNDRR